jgi:hypothetical protein
MKGFWPISIHLVRCRAIFWKTNFDKKRYGCGKLLWPWQDIVREYDPECGGCYVHHECHHRSVKELWEDSEILVRDWEQELNCEHKKP